MYIFTQSINGISMDQKLTCPTELQTLLLGMNLPNGIFQSKVESSGGEGKISDKYLPIWTLLYVSFKHILSIISFMGITNFMKTLDKTST
jgi:hypothetical protein